MGDDKHGVCQSFTGGDSALKGRGGILSAVRLRSEAGNEKGRARLWRRLGIEERRVDNREGNGCKKDDYKSDRMFHGREDRKTKLKNICDEILRIQKKNFTFMLYQTRPD
jgi:hypothetical protein